MILIADSGSTKTDWCLVDKGALVKQVFTKGTNPFFQTEDEISNEVEQNLLPCIEAAKVEAVWFYGAGCAFPEKNEIVRKAIARHLDVPIEVGSDMLGAARGLCGRQPGIACIMGTGSNSCFYDGKEIVSNVSPLGFILGDEGSGAVLGKLLVGDILKNQMPAALKEEFLATYELTPAIILERVYKKPFPNRFLASVSPFLVAHLDVPEVHSLVLNAFKAFFNRNVKQYDYQHNPVHLIGSVAWYYRTVLEEAAAETGIQLGTIMQSPMEGLISYHSEKN